MTPMASKAWEALEVGILGAGQLGQMLALAGLPLGMRFVFVDPAAESPCAGLGEHLVAAYDSPEAIARLARCPLVYLRVREPRRLARWRHWRR